MLAAGDRPSGEPSIQTLAQAAKRSTSYAECRELKGRIRRPVASGLDSRNLRFGPVFAMRSPFLMTAGVSLLVASAL
ncbi:hypothetical protein CFB84_20945 [Burkholderia aenigmatica]|uniref:Uncharacterized protein n=1 Tax=Burkholderia aenigmatica TaxID=2015348 RepID=A0A228IHY6_9BURK|nr:hypothetical protein CFB84_20945 [Burkholderia aenigmatica]